MSTATPTTGKRRILARMSWQPINLCISREIAEGPSVTLQILNGNVHQKAVTVHVQTGRTIVWADYGFEFGEQIMPKEQAQRIADYIQDRTKDQPVYLDLNIGVGLMTDYYLNRV